MKERALALLSLASLVWGLAISAPAAALPSSELSPEISLKFAKLVREAFRAADDKTKLTVELFVRDPELLALEHEATGADMTFQVRRSLQLAFEFEGKLAAAVAKKGSLVRYRRFSDADGDERLVLTGSRAELLELLAHPYVLMVFYVYYSPPETPRKYRSEYDDMKQRLSETIRSRLLGDKPTVTSHAVVRKPTLVSSKSVECERALSKPEGTGSSEKQ